MSRVKVWGDVNKKTNFCPSFTVLWYYQFCAGYMSRFRFSSRAFSNLRKNRYRGGPNTITTRMKMKNISLHPIAKTGLHESKLIDMIVETIKIFFFIVPLSITRREANSNYHLKFASHSFWLFVLFSSVQTLSRLLPPAGRRSLFRRESL